MNAALQTAEQERAEAGVGAAELEREPQVAPGDANGGGGHSGPPPPPNARDRNIGYGRRKPPRWQVLLVLGITFIVSFLVGWLIGRTGAIVIEGLEARANKDGS
jgi:hypothetical protein